VPGVSATLGGILPPRPAQRRTVYPENDGTRPTGGREPPRRLETERQAPEPRLSLPGRPLPSRISRFGGNRGDGGCAGAPFCGSGLGGTGLDSSRVGMSVLHVIDNARDSQKRRQGQDGEEGNPGLDRQYAITGSWPVRSSTYRIFTLVIRW